MLRDKKPPRSETPCEQRQRSGWLMSIDERFLPASASAALQLGDRRHRNQAERLPGIVRRPYATGVGVPVPSIERLPKHKLSAMALCEVQPVIHFTPILGDFAIA